MIREAHNWVAIEEFGLAKEEWFTELLGQRNKNPPLFAENLEVLSELDSTLSGFYEKQGR